VSLDINIEKVGKFAGLENADSALIHTHLSNFSPSIVRARHHPCVEPSLPCVTRCLQVDYGEVKYRDRMLPSTGLEQRSYNERKPQQSARAPSQPVATNQAVEASFMSSIPANQSGMGTSMPADHDATQPSHRATEATQAVRPCCSLRLQSSIEDLTTGRHLQSARAVASTATGPATAVERIETVQPSCPHLRRDFPTSVPGTYI
jgi:hypothetical protein